MKLYNTVEKEGTAEQTIERSRFIAYVKPVSSKEEADDFVAEIRRKHRDATHNVPAMVIGDKMQIQWASDDGEPQARILCRPLPCRNMLRRKQAAVDLPVRLHLSR